MDNRHNNTVASHLESNSSAIN